MHNLQQFLEALVYSDTNFNYLRNICRLNSPMLVVDTVGFSYSYHPCSPTSWWSAWRSGSKFQTTSRIELRPWDFKIQAATTTLLAWGAMPWNTCPISFSRVNWKKCFSFSQIHISRRPSINGGLSTRCVGLNYFFFKFKSFIKVLSSLHSNILEKTYIHNEEVEVWLQLHPIIRACQIDKNFVLACSPAHSKTFDPLSRRIGQLVQSQTI